MLDLVGGPSGPGRTRSSGPDRAPVVGPRFPHLPALDGLRGIAVALVVAYHLAPDLVPGGFLGVDVFFVLSGFLITSLLLDEARSSGGIRLGEFYVRRVRRLAPALLLVIAALSLYAALWATPGELSRIREHSLWTLGYLANWELIADGTTYTEVVAGQSPLRHAWSLAIEEQFYVVFPFLVLLVGHRLRWDHARLRRRLLAVAGVGALASAAWMSFLWGNGQDPSRGYFGTDTRAHSLLIGVGLGALLVGRPPRTGRAAAVAAVAGPVGIAVLVAAVAVSHEDARWLQHGGFLAVAVAVAAVISDLERSRRLRRVLSSRPLVALGVISYGVYLWHWPVVVLVDEARTGVEGPALAALRLGLTLGAALASYVLIERPVRQGVLGRGMGRGALAVAPAAVAGVVVAVLVTTALPTAPMPALATTPAGVAPAVATAPPGADLRSTGTEPTHPPLELVVLGDSVAHTLAGGTVGSFPDFEPWTSEQSPADPERARIWSVARPACSFLPGGLVVGDGPPADLSGYCGDWQGDLTDALASRPGAVVLVALANDASHRWIDGSTVELASAEHDALVSGLLDEVRALATRGGATLALVALPPRIGSFATGLDDDGRRERVFRDLLLDYAAGHPAVRVLDLFEAICPGGDCDRPPAGFDPGWRYDGMHYTVDGARWVATWLAQELSP